MNALRFEDLLSSEDLTQLALTAQDIHQSLQKPFQKVSTPHRACLTAYCLLNLAFEKCQDAFGPELSLKLVEDYRDQLQAVVKDQSVKNGYYEAEA
jgi:hypothetical protein